MARCSLFATMGLTIILAMSVKGSDVVLRVNENCACGESGGGISSRIIGGYETLPHEYPWVAALLNRGKLHCGATIINDRYVLTAGHCVKWIEMEELTVAVGYHNITDTKEGYVVDIDKIFTHEDFNSDILHDMNDLAVIRLAYPIEFQEDIKPICLPEKGHDYTNLKAKVVGWGYVGGDDEESQVLKETSLKVISDSECKNSSVGEMIADSMICTYRDNNDVCQGDSGGPLLRERANGNYEIIGIISWGVGCAAKNVPGVYVKVADYREWIEHAARDGIFCANP